MAETVQPEPGVAAGPPMTRQPASREQLKQFAEGGFLFAITDAAEEPLLAAMLNELGPSRAAPLVVSGGPQEIVPYIMAVDPLLLTWLQSTVWQRPWGTFVLSKGDLAALQEHFSRFLMVRLPDGDHWFFRFYDPRVLINYLPNCSPAELEQFFGPARAFAIPNPDSGEVELVQWAAAPAPAAAAPEPPAAAPEPAAPQAPAAPTPSGVWDIRPEQYAAFHRVPVGSFQARVAEHLRQFFPEQCEALGEQGLVQAIQYGLERALAHGMSLEVDVCKYIDLMFTFGVDFDRELEWAADILGDPTEPEASKKMERLFQAAAEQVQRALGSAAG